MDLYFMICVIVVCYFFFSSKRGHTRCALVTGVQTCALPIYGDHNSDWKATPEALRKAVDAYNGANQHTKDLYIEQIQREPKMARAVGQLIGERELILQRDRGMSL